MISQADKVNFLTEAAKRFGNVITRQQLKQMYSEGFARQRWLTKEEFRVGRGSYRLPLDQFNVNLNLASNVVEMPVQNL